MERGAYTDPKAYGVDYSVITEASQKAMDDISKSVISLQQQRKEAYEKLQNDYDKFMDDTYIERMKTLDQQQNEAIQNSVRMSLVDFSNASDYTKKQKLEEVQRLKYMRQNMEGIIAAVNTTDAYIDKRLDAKKYNFGLDLASGKNIEIVPKANGIGMEIKHYLTDKDGNRTGESQTITESDINAMSVQFQDVAPVLDSVEEQFTAGAGYVQKKIDELAKEGKRATEDQINTWLQDAMEANNQALNNKQRAIYFSNQVDEFNDFVPDELPDGNGGTRKLTFDEQESFKARNLSMFNQAGMEFMRQRITQKAPDIPDVKEEKGGGQPSPIEINYMNEFDKDYNSMVKDGKTSFMDKWTKPLGYEVSFSGDGKNLIFYKKSVDYDKKYVEDALKAVDNADGGDITANDKLMKKLNQVGIKRGDIRVVPLGTPDTKRIFYNTYRNFVNDENKPVAAPYGWANYLDMILINENNQVTPNSQQQPTQFNGGNPPIIFNGK